MLANLAQVSRSFVLSCSLVLGGGALATALLLLLRLPFRSDSTGVPEDRFTDDYSAVGWVGGLVCNIVEVIPELGVRSRPLGDAAQDVLATSVFRAVAVGMMEERVTPSRIFIRSLNLSGQRPAGLGSHHVVWQASADLVDDRDLWFDLLHPCCFSFWIACPCWYGRYYY